MVSQASYAGHNDRRSGRVFPPFMSQQSRRLQSPPRESRSVVKEHTESADAPSRKRIAVACGRCRQRKIRCTGGSSQLEPCSNCKNAGVTQCLFLRVSSRETPIKGDIGHGGEFHYDSLAARALAHRSAMPYGQQYLTAHSFSSDVYRPGDIFPESRPYYTGLPAWGGAYDYGNYAVSEPGSSTAYSVINKEPSHMVPCHWDGRAKLAHPLHRPEADSEATGVPMPASYAPSVALSDTDDNISARRVYSYGSSALTSFKSSDTSAAAAASAAYFQVAAPLSEPVDPVVVYGAPPYSAKYPDTRAYAIASLKESIFSDQERSLGTQGPVPSHTSYTYHAMPERLLYSSTQHVSKAPAEVISEHAYMPTEGPSKKQIKAQHSRPATVTVTTTADEEWAQEQGRSGLSDVVQK